MQYRTIGTRSVSAVGLGGMPMSIEGRPDRERAIATIHAALDAGIDFIDTADAYHIDASDDGHNELLIAEALGSYSGDASGVLVATKGGHIRPGGGAWNQDGSPEHLKAAALASRDRLGVERIGLWQFHRPDPQVDYAASLGAVKELLDDGVIEMAGISQRRRRPDPSGQRHPGRSTGIGAEPVLAEVPLQPARARSLRRARYRVPAVEPAGRDHLGGGTGLEACGVPGDRERARHQPAGRLPRLGALALAAGSCRSRAPRVPRPSPTRRRPPTSS